MTTGDQPQAQPAFTTGIDLLLERGWGQEVIHPTRAKSGHWMTAAELPEDAYDLVVDGQVDPARARRLYDRATELFDGAVARLGPLDAG